MSPRRNGWRIKQRSGVSKKEQLIDDSIKQMKRIDSQLKDSRSKMGDIFKDSDDISFHDYQFGHHLSIQSFIMHCQSLVQKEKVNFVKSLLQDVVKHEVGPANEITLDRLKHFVINHGVTNETPVLINDYEEATTKVLAGYFVLFIDGWDQALAFEAISIEGRAVDEPSTESVIIGPHEGTVEDLKKNIGLIRSRMQSKHLKLKSMHVGKVSRTEIAYMYLEGAVDAEVLSEFERRMEKVKELEILETTFIEELIEDSTLSPFPQYRYTERPDTANAALLDGKIIVLVHGTGSILICPALYLELFQSVEDYYQRSIISTTIRLMRFIAVIIALTLPSVYIALSTFHPEMIPTILLLAIINTREGIPFPALIEALIMVFFFELMREAGIRMPKPVGQAVSIVGALIIGEAAIQAGIASPIMVVVVALTGISSFAVPQYNLGISYRILQFPLMFLAATLGGFGIMVGLLLILLHLSSLRSLGIPYLAPFAPLRPNKLRDAFIRVSIGKLLRSPRNHKEHQFPQASNEK
ncbi:spore germination protein [Halalkalibacter sp. AB-rgal2]|uniref:spore germination protein n=1 Tax=Halalkalibacter sp. AB-rgal2 TaxID=3242695 RepID=UPI00359EF34D